MIKKCLRCKKKFYTKPSEDGKYCSRSCYAIPLPNCINCNKKLSLHGCKRCKSCEIKRRWKVGMIKKSMFPPSWLKGTKGLVGPNKGSFKKGQFLGNKHPMWKGGITKLNYPRMTSEYLSWVKKIYERDKYTCQICGDKSGDINVHHIKPWSLYPELRMNGNNVMTVCVNCHKKTDTYAGRIFNYVCN